MNNDKKTAMITRLKSDLGVNFKSGDDSVLSDFIGK